MADFDTLEAIVIGGTGGSGSRALAELCHVNGMAMPKPRNSAHDWLVTRHLYNFWTKRILALTGGLDYRFADLPKGMRAAIETEFRAALAEAVPAAGAGLRFGWKNPRSLMLVPVLAHFLPRLSYLHLVRDGRDMVLSQNDNQTSRYGKFLFAEPEAGGPELAAARFWSRANLEAMTAGRRLIGERYHVVRFEEACTPGNAALPALLAALGLRQGRIDGIFVAPESIGRWKTLEPSLAAAVEAAARPGLEAFGYL